MTNIVKKSSYSDPPRIISILKLLILLFFFLFFFLSFLQVHVDNHDFWWHLATGKYIVETGSLPQEDPFSFTTPTTPSSRIPVILKGYWLAQVIFYKVYALWDVTGIAVLRSFLMLLFLLFVFLSVKNRTSSVLMALLFTSVIFLIAVPYSADRPQLFTFLIFSMIYYLFEAFTIVQSRKIFLIPVFTLISSNMHPGYIVCLVLISVYLLSSGIRHFIMNDPKEKSRFKTLLVVWMASIISSMMNPTGLSEFKEILHINEHTQDIVEFLPTISLFARRLTPLNYPYISFLFFSLLSLSEFRRIGLNRIVLLVAFSAMSFISIRYLIFYMCISAPILAQTALIMSEKKVFAKTIGTVNAKKPFLYLTACLLGVFLLLSSLSSLGSRDIKMDFLSEVPENAADFLKGLSIQGNMLNDYGFGGYLIWRLYPEKKVFIDGRTLSSDVYDEYKIAILARNNQPQSWEDIIRKYGVSYIVVPPLLYHGQILPLVEKLYDSNDWALIYKDDISLIFLRNESKNTLLINQFAMDKIEVLNAIVANAVAKSAVDRINPYYLISAGKALVKLGRHDEAEKAFLTALERAPENAEAAGWIRQLRDRR